MNIGFCVIISKSRLFQGIAMYRSLKKKMKDFKLFILCTDSECYLLLKELNLEKVELLHVSELEDAELLALKQERTENEYCWTLKPVFLSYVMMNYPDIDIVTHLDADLYFFSDPTPIFKEMENCSVLLVTHLHLVNDDCNSGFVSFKRDEKGLQCLNWWRQQCIAWCFFRYEKNKFGDQKYLDTMLVEFDQVRIVKTPGVNIGVWNSHRFKFTSQESKVYVNDDLLVFYHFCGFRLVNTNTYAMLYSIEDIPAVYIPYAKEIKRAIQKVEKIRPELYRYFDEEDSTLDNAKMRIL